jgi:hypothetical protein
MRSLLNFSERALRFAGNTLLRASQRITPLPKLTADERKLLARNERFRDIHRGRRAFVIGTGPSLQTQNLAPLGDEITFTLSAFWKHPIVNEWEPTYYCFSDPLLFDGSQPMREFFARVVSHVPHATFFLPLEAREVVTRQNLLPGDQIYYFAPHGDLAVMDVAELDLTTFIPGVMNVAQVCIMLAIYMGASPIFLLGLDHDWLSHQNEVKHFYSGHAGLEEHPELRPVLSDWSYKFLMECQLTGWNAYESLLRLSERQGIRIVNATAGGFLDVFARANYEELIQTR